jgi:peptidoglycan-associated lipoprotein
MQAGIANGVSLGSVAPRIHRPLDSNRPNGPQPIPNRYRDAPPMDLKILSAFAAVSLLAACTTPADTGAAAGSGSTVATAGGPQAGSQEDLVKNVGDRVFFGFDSATLRPDDHAVLDRQATWLAQFAQNNVEIAGNTDERGTEEYNIALGQRRANAARDYLVAKGVAGSRISTVSYGKDRPSALGSDEQAWAQNRNAITSVR